MPSLHNLSRVETQVRIRGPGEDGIEAGPQRSDGLRAGSMARGPEITLRDHVIVSVVEPRTRLPCIGAPHVEESAAETLLAADIGEACHADPEGALFPAPWIARFFLEAWTCAASMCASCQSATRAARASTSLRAGASAPKAGTARTGTSKETSAKTCFIRYPPAKGDEPRVLKVRLATY